MDSSALGMLLILREHAGNNKKSVKIVNCNQDVNKILSVSDFSNMFEIA